MVRIIPVLCIAMSLLSTSMGCAGAQKLADEACQKITIADHYAGAALKASVDLQVDPRYVRDYVVPLARTVLEAYNWCYEEPKEQ